MAELDRPLGLSRGAVIVKPYDVRWQNAYAKVEQRLETILEPLSPRIEHIGSTAVPGLAAKPVLDVAIGLSSRSNLDAAVRRLVENGYEWREDAGDAGGVIVVDGPESARTHYLHLVPTDDPQWQRYLSFRDALRRDRVLRDRYAALKVELAERFPANRAA